MKSLASSVRTEILRRYVTGGREFVFRASGHSMQPLIHPGDRLHVSHVSSFHRGDILVVDQNGRLVVHRLTRIDGHQPDDWQLILRGDNQRHNDAPVYRQDVVGRVVWIERRGQVMAMDGWWGRLHQFLASISLFGNPVMPLLRSVRTRGRSLKSLRRVSKALVGAYSRPNGHSAI